MRFQPSLGRYLATVVGGGVSIVDVQTAQSCGNPLMVCCYIFSYSFFEFLHVI